MHFLALDQMLPADHRARTVWQFVDSLDLTALYDQIQAVEGTAGRNPVDPRILMALWILATIEGVSSARRLDELCRRDIAYMWICGGVGVNYHLLSDFRTGHLELLDQLLTDSVATLLHQGLVTLDRVAQDGMRVRASAGSSSFRREQTLQECHRQAQEQVERLRAENESDPSACDRRTKAARERAAREREARIKKALEELQELQQRKEKRKKGDGQNARTSTTDPEARKMKMADGGYRPAYNVQFATACDSRVIVGVDVVNSGGDGGQMAPMVQQVEHRYHQRPREYLADGGFATKDDITELESSDTQVFAPIKEESQQRERGKDPYARHPKDNDQTFRWRQRMSTEAAKSIYRERASTAEFPNAECRNRGLTQFRVRGLRKVKAVALWHALAFNFMRMQSLGPQAAGAFG
jgi:transposase